MNIESKEMLLVNSSSNQLQSSQSFAQTCNVLNGGENMSNLCRTCANVTEFVIPIFVDEGLHNNLAQKIQQHLPIKISEDDILPHVVCYQCASTILAWHDLVECCLQADVSLRQRLTSLTSETKFRTKSNQRIEDNEENSTKKCVPGPGSEPAETETYVDCADLADDDDDEPLSSVAGKKSAELYRNFYSALLNFRNHFTTEHEGSSTDDSSDSDGGGSAAEIGAEYDDLSRCNMRRDRMSNETRVELARAQTRIDGKVYFACEACGKHLSSAQTYLFHRRIHTGERPCVCHVCGKQFRTPGGLQRHLAETHERRRLYACALCHKTFANSQNLKAHARIHTGEKPFVCAQCGKRFTQSGSLHAHTRGHSALHPHRCAECGAQFKLRAGLARHALRHTGERPHACGTCARTFRHRHELAAHALTHTDARPHTCRLCGSAFRQRKALRHHCKRVHEEEDASGLIYDHIGPSDDKRENVARPVDLNVRAESSAPPPVPPETCTYCRAECPEAQLKEHLISTHSELLFRCDECDSYVDRQDFVAHMSHHAVEDAGDAEPPANAEETRLAGKTTEDVDPAGDVPEDEDPGGEVRKDTRDVDENENRGAKDKERDGEASDNGDDFSENSDAEYFCQLPESVFEAIEDSQDTQAADDGDGLSQNDASEYNDGATRGVDEVPRPSPPPVGPTDGKKDKKERACPVCSKVYTASSSYFYHLKHSHGGDRQHECDVCGRRFTAKPTLAQHLLIHAAERPYACAQCGKTFRARAALYVHEQTHGGRKAHACGECGRSFRWRAHLERHRRRHEGGRAHVCGACGRGFSVRADLLRHARTHSAAALPCPHCPLRFAQPRYLRAHVHNKHAAEAGSGAPA